MTINRSTAAIAAGLMTLLCHLAFSTQPINAQEPQNGVASREARKATEPATTASLMGPVPIGGPWIEFAFFATGSSAIGCSPADPGGPSCAPSSGGNSVFGGTPPWTFTAPPGGVTLKVTDAFLRGDRFEVFDFGASIGLTSVPSTTGDCGDNPDPCFTDPLVSHAIFTLAAGPHQITIKANASPFGGGAAYFRIDAAPTQMDHWLCYDIKSEGRFKERRVVIKNQFESQSYVVIAPHMLCVPSSKELRE
ncbi:MAG TPA: hypothetical protein VN851_27910 [Thermoanaerobaculia bacterium]|nr:hypothetical protein [Thermoanaerobaculia bacterium]